MVLRSARDRGEFGWKGTELNGLLTLSGNETRPAITLAPLQETDKVQWDIDTHANWPRTPEEGTAYDRLSVKLAETAADMTINVIGPLKKDGSSFYLEVRMAAIDSVAA